MIDREALAWALAERIHVCSATALYLSPADVGEIKQFLAPIIDELEVERLSDYPYATHWLKLYEARQTTDAHLARLGVKT